MRSRDTSPGMRQLQQHPLSHRRYDHGVPEPETYGMLVGGLALIGVAARRHKRQAA